MMQCPDKGSHIIFNGQISEFNRTFGSNKMDIWALRKIVSIKKNMVFADLSTAMIFITKCDLGNQLPQLMDLCQLFLLVYFSFKVIPLK